MQAIVFHDTKHLASLTSLSNATRRLLLNEIKFGTSQVQAFYKHFMLLKNKLRLWLVIVFFVSRRGIGEGYLQVYCHHHLEKSSCLFSLSLLSSSTSVCAIIFSSTSSLTISMLPWTMSYASIVLEIEFNDKSFWCFSQ